MVTVFWQCHSLLTILLVVIRSRSYVHLSTK
jgi:hypothetical protein